MEGDINVLLEAFNDNKIGDLKALKSNYERQIKWIQEVDEEITNLIITEEELEKEISESLEENDRLFKVLSKIHQVLEDVTPLQSPTAALPRIEHGPSEQMVGI